MSQSRKTALQQFLHASGWQDARISALAGDASNRRYIRLACGDRKAIAMDAPPESGESVAPFIAMTSWLRANGYSAPQIYASDPSQGFLLLEDLGDNLYSQHLTETLADETALYERAVDVLIDMAKLDVPDQIGRPPSEMIVQPYSTDVLEREALLLVEWWITAALDREPTDAQNDAFRQIIRDLCAEVATTRSAMVLRDYHADNLIWLPERHGVAAVGLLDYQDVLVGHPAYDLVSLLEDARRDTPADLREAMVQRYLDGCPEQDPDAFRQAYFVLGAQRNLKILGIFTRLAVRDGKARYLSMIPRVWQHLQNDLRHPALSELSNWISANVPTPEPVLLDRIGSQQVLETR